MSLSDIIRSRIETTGPITVAEYMQLALSHPEFGYYIRKDPLGEAGDFTTAPEISQIFGELVGAWLAQQWLHMKSPECALAELGPGRGTLMYDILRATRGVPGFHDAISVHLVETSPALKQKQWQALAGKHPRITWHKSIDTLPETPRLIVANEFFDALPIHQYVQQDGTWHERMVGLDGDGRFCFMLNKPSPFGRGQGEGDIYEHSPATLHIVEQLSRHIAAQGGVMLAVDYGYAEEKHADTLQAVKNHQYHNPLESPGSADITAHVDFAAIAKITRAQGAQAYGTVAQGEFLATLGAGARAAKLCERATPAQKADILTALERLTSPDAMGDLFKVLCITSPSHPKPEGF